MLDSPFGKHDSILIEFEDMELNLQIFLVHNLSPIIIGFARDILALIDVNAYAIYMDVAVLKLR